MGAVVRAVRGTEMPCCARAFSHNPEVIEDLPGVLRAKRLVQLVTQHVKVTSPKKRLSR